jgi:mono/diheme cytochrome c family protein
MRLNMFLLLAFLATVAANWIIRPDTSKPNLEYLPEMVHSAAYDSFSPNPNFPDGKTLQPPVPGTIRRGYQPLHYGATPEDAARAGNELINPWKADQPGVIERGALVFNTFCQPCHGVTARGDGPVALRGYPPPPSLLVDKAINLKDGQIFHILTYGQKNMPSYASQISPTDRWKVILYVRSLQQKAQQEKERRQTARQISETRQP